MKRFYDILGGAILAIMLTVGIYNVLPHSNANEGDTEIARISEIKTLKKVEVQKEVVEEPLPQVCHNEDGTPKMCSDEDAIKFLFLSLGEGGLKGLGIAFVIAKFLLMFILSPGLSMKIPFLQKGSVKITVAIGLNLAVSILTLMVYSNLSFGAALTHSSVLAAFSVFGNQVFKQYLTKKGKS